MTIPIEKLSTPPLCAEEKHIISDFGAWRGLAYPAFIVGLSAGAFIKQRKPHAINSTKGLEGSIQKVPIL